MNEKSQKIESFCKSLYELQVLLRLRENQVDVLLQEYAEQNREFEEGEIVEVLSKVGEYVLGKGVVTSVKTSVYTDNLSLKPFFEPSENYKPIFDASLNDLRYEVYKLTKNGEKGKNHFFESPHFIGTSGRYSDVIIRKIKL
jgi:hypothetical protein